MTADELEKMERDTELAARMGLSLRDMLNNCDLMADRIAVYIKQAMCNNNVAFDGELDNLFVRAKRLRNERSFVFNKLMESLR